MKNDIESLFEEGLKVQNEGVKLNYFWKGVRWAGAYLLLMFLLTLLCGLFMYLKGNKNIVSLFALAPMMSSTVIHPVLIWILFLVKVLVDRGKSPKPGFLIGFLLGTLILAVLGILLAILSIAHTPML